MGIAHWDEVPKRRSERGAMAATWTNLGTPAGSSRCGVQRIEMGPREQPTPVHVHGAAEEIFYVVGGSGLTWMDGNAYEVREGDCIVYKNNFEAHTLRGGDDGLDVLAFGEREYLPRGSLPRAGVMWGIVGVLEEPEAHPVRRGSVVARPPGTGIAHTFRGGDNGLTLLAWGTRVPGDLTYYPRSRKVNFQGLGIIGRVEHVDYWDGEDLE